MIKDKFKVTGMTCNACVAKVTNELVKVEGVTDVIVDLEKGEAEISMNKHILLGIFKSALPEKYGISRMIGRALDEVSEQNKALTKFQQLKPLFLIFGYIIAAVLLLNYKEWNAQSAMLDFMGLFYIVFSFFKLLDLKGFPDSFRMYDPLAKLIPVYGWVYPFIELALGILFLMRFQITIALIATILFLGITTIGVTRTLLDKKSIRCACLGTALKLPMTEATFIENAIMLVMAFAMLSPQFN